MSEKLTAWRSISVEVHPAPELEGPEPTSLALFQNDLEARVKRSANGLALRERGAADLVLRVFVRGLTHAAIVGGTAELTADVELIASDKHPGFSHQLAEAQLQILQPSAVLVTLLCDDAVTTRLL